MVDSAGELESGEIQGDPLGKPGSKTLLELYQRLHERYGPQHWWPGESRFEVIIGAILTQGTSWTNVERALSNLKASGCFSPQQLWQIPEAELATLLKPSGFFNAKARKLKAFINHLWDHYDGDLEELLAKEVSGLRAELLSIHGIGEETADDIILYAAAKPSFVIDSYTRRILKRLGLAPARETYKEYQGLFHRGLPLDAPIYNEYHALLDRHAKETCRKQPLCGGCCLRHLCPTGRFLLTQSPPETYNYSQTT